MSEKLQEKETGNSRAPIWKLILVILGGLFLGALIYLVLFIILQGIGARWLTFWLGEMRISLRCR